MMPGPKGFRVAIRLKKAARIPPISLRYLPTEIRDMVFEYLLTFPKVTYLEQQPKTPAIIVALRPEPKVYDEALQIYYKRNTFRITSHNFESVQQLERTYISSVRDLIVGDLYSDNPDYIDFVTNTRSRYMDFTTNTDSRLLEFTNLEKLCLSTDFPRVKCKSEGPPVFAMGLLVAGNTKLRKLEFWTPRGYWTAEQAFLSAHCMNSILRQKQRRDIIKGDKDSGPFWWHDRNFDVTAWEAEVGDALELVESLE